MSQLMSVGDNILIVANHTEDNRACAFGLVLGCAGLMVMDRLAARLRLPAEDAWHRVVSASVTMLAVA